MKRKIIKAAAKTTTTTTTATTPIATATDRVVFHGGFRGSTQDA
jgi:hypothetical protein